MQRWNLSALGILGLLVVTLAGFPYYSHALTEMVSPSAPRRQLTGGTVTASFLVPDMDCPACAVGLRAAFERLPGVNHATVDFNTHRATITYNPTQQRRETFAKLVADAGFHVKPPS